MSNKSWFYTVASAVIDVCWPRRTQSAQVKCFRKGFMEEDLELDVFIHALMPQVLNALSMHQAVF